MNYSRAGGPTPVNKPGVDKRIDDKMEILLEQQQALEEAIAYYNKKIALNDGWKEWYENALGSYQRKYDKVKQEISNTSGVKYEPSTGGQAVAEVPAVGEGQASNKKEVVGSKKP